ncbi:MAG: hypothetical protein U5K56_09365 [Halioglobus sp.]|nr:hypothetical protein [Halioglobus sp.]
MPWFTADYSALGAVHVKLDDDGLSISNPGGFVEGVNLDNLLVADPALSQSTAGRHHQAHRLGRAHRPRHRPDL